MCIDVVSIMGDSSTLYLFSQEALKTQRYRDFVHLLVSLTAGGPPWDQLCWAIENNTLKVNALKALVWGFPLVSYDTNPADWTGTQPQDHAMDYGT